MQILENYFMKPDINKLILSFYRCIMTTHLDLVRSVDKNFLNHSYAGVPLDSDEKPSIEEYIGFSSRLQKALQSSDDNQIEEMANNWAKLIIENPYAKRSFMISLLLDF